MAAYAHNFVVSIIGPTGQPLREIQEANERTIRLPFESEYKIRLKNKNYVRAKVSVLIDGMDISPGRMFILAPNQTLDLERFIQDGDLNKGNKFKFVNREKGAATGEIQDPYSHKLGCVEVIFHKEQQSCFTTFTTTYPTWQSLLFDPNISVQGGGTLYACNTGAVGNSVVGSSIIGTSTNYHMSTNSVSNSSTTGGASGVAGGAVNCSTGAGAAAGMSLKSNSASTILDTLDLSPNQGGTAMGGESGQQFQDSWTWFNTEMPITISIKLRGLKQDEPKPTAPVLSEAQAIIERGLSAHATKQERDTAKAFLALMVQVQAHKG